MKFTRDEIRKAMLLYAVTDQMWLKEGETLRRSVKKCWTTLNSCSPARPWVRARTARTFYHAAANRLGAAPTEAAVYEAALYAVKAAKDAGYYVVAVYDDSAKDHWKELTQLLDEQARSWK